jgi:hypothetical protein
VIGANGEVITDRDIVFRHIETGTEFRMEVKDATPESQRGNIERYKAQIRTMAEEFNTTNRRQIWVNRRKAIPELEEYASQRGVDVYDEVGTGKQFRGKHFDDVIEELHMSCMAETHVRVLSGGANLGLGIWMVAANSGELCREIEAATNSGTRSEAGLLRLGTSGLQVLAGGSLAFSGTVETLGTFSDVVANSPWLMGASRLGGPIGIAAIVGSEAILFVQYNRGHISWRQFTYSTWSLAGGVVGGIAGGVAGAETGAETGAAIGGCIGGPVGAGIGGTIGGALGGVGGGLAGAWGGSKIAHWATDAYYEFKDQKQEDTFKAFLLAYYK